MRLDEDLFTFIFHHVFFPPKLPQTLDRNLPDLESKLLGVVQDVLQDYIAALPLECRSPWEITLNMLGNWIKCDTKVGICKKSLERVLSNIESEGKTTPLSIMSFADNRRRRRLSHQTTELRMDGVF